MPCGEIEAGMRELETCLPFGGVLGFYAVVLVNQPEAESDMRLRSMLYVPAHNERFVFKSPECGADAVILDLEDAVPEDCKDLARDALAEAGRRAGTSGAKVFVRVNATDRLVPDSEAASRAGVDGVVLPKVECPEDVDAVPGTLPIIALIESAAGILSARDVAAHPRVLALNFGAEDFATDTDALAEPDVLRVPILLVHYAAKAESKMSLGLFRSVAQFDDPDGLSAAANEAARHGFDGATCIHPKVVPVLNGAFTPDAARIAHARKVIHEGLAAEAEGRGAFMIDGEFVDAPVLTRYRRLLSRAGIDPEGSDH